MQEDFLHYLWKYKKFNLLELESKTREKISIVSTGTHNHNSGPDFFNSKLKIGEQLWAGNVEIHLKSSDWFVHNHENDANYDNVILHVVWEHDVDVFRKDNSQIPTLELKDYVSKIALNNYEVLFNKKQKWINCEYTLKEVDSFIISNWLERLYFERLERKHQDIQSFLKASKNDWEGVLFKMLVKNFGLKVNGDAFLSIANSIDYTIVRKTRHKLESLEALFLGQANLLQHDIQDSCLEALKKNYTFLEQKFNLSKTAVIPIQFFRLRPANFPTIRLSQLAVLYHTVNNLFSLIIEAKTLEDFYTIFSIETSNYWKTHYTFSKPSKASKKKLTKAFIDLLIINTILPIKYSYAKHQGKTIDDSLINLIEQIASEKNSIVNKFNSIKEVSKSALESQAIIQLKTEYCDKNKCLQCAIGNTILTQSKLTVLS